MNSSCCCLFSVASSPFTNLLILQGPAWNSKKLHLKQYRPNRKCTSDFIHLNTTIFKIGYWLISKATQTCLFREVLYLSVYCTVFDSKLINANYALITAILTCFCVNFSLSLCLQDWNHYSVLNLFSLTTFNWIHFLCKLRTA